MCREDGAPFCLTQLSDVLRGATWNQGPSAPESPAGCVLAGDVHGALLFIGVTAFAHVHVSKTPFVAGGWGFGPRVNVDV